MTDLDIVRKAASETRRWAMRNRHRFDSDNTLSCLCAIATFHLFQKLRAYGIDCKIALKNRGIEGHCIIVTDDHIVDVTATQFDPGLKAVCIVDRHQKQPSFWQPTKFFTCQNEFVAYLRKTRWPNDQLPKAQ